MPALEGLWKQVQAASARGTTAARVHDHAQQEVLALAYAVGGGGHFSLLCFLLVGSSSTWVAQGLRAVAQSRAQYPLPESLSRSTYTRERALARPILKGVSRVATYCVARLQRANCCASQFKSDTSVALNSLILAELSLRGSVSCLNQEHMCQSLLSL